MTKTQQRIIEAIQRGYRIDGGRLIGPKGPLTIALYGKQRYPTFSTNWDGVFGVPVHHFAAYQYYGIQSFNPDLVIRHKNGNTLDISRDNILLGTHSENNLDKLPESRVKAAKLARASQNRLPSNTKLSAATAQEIRDAYKSLAGKKAPNGFTEALCKKYGVSRPIINFARRGKTYDPC